MIRRKKIVLLRKFKAREGLLTPYVMKEWETESPRCRVAQAVIVVTVIVVAVIVVVITLLTILRPTDQGKETSGFSSTFAMPLYIHSRVH